MKLTLSQKKALMAVSTPFVRTAYIVHRALSGHLWVDHAVPADPRSILIIRLDTIGDVLLSEPAISALRRRFPSARIDLITRGSGKALLEGNRHVDAHIVFDAPWYANWRGLRISWRRELRRTLACLRELRREKYDLAVELRGDYRDLLFAVATGARVVVGSSWRGGRFLLDHDAPVDLDAHRVELALTVAATAGADPRPAAPKLYLNRLERALAQELLPEKRAIYIAMHLGAGFPSKCLPVSTFADVAKELWTRWGASLIVLGGPEDRPIVDSFLGNLPFQPLDLAGKLTLKETAAVLERCRLFVGNDSGPMHMAAAVGTPVVAFFGPSEPRNYRPYGVDYRIVEVDLDCRPCDHVHCVHDVNYCMTSISPERIIVACNELLDSIEVRG